MPLVSRWGSEVLTTGAFEPDTNKPRPITLGFGSKPVPIDLLGKTDVLGTFVERTRVSSRGSWVERPRPLKGRGSSGQSGPSGGGTAGGDTGDTGGGAVAPLAGPSDLEAVIPAPLAGPSDLTANLDTSTEETSLANSLKFFSATISDGNDGFATDARDNQAGSITAVLKYSNSPDTVSYNLNFRYLKINSEDTGALITLPSETHGDSSYEDQRGKLSGSSIITLNASTNPGYEFSRWEVINNFSSEDAPLPSYGTLQVVGGSVTNPQGLTVKFPLGWDSLTDAVEVRAVYKKVMGYATDGFSCFPVYYPDPSDAPFPSMEACEEQLPSANPTELIQVFTNTDMSVSATGYTGGYFEVTNFDSFSTEDSQDYSYSFDPTVSNSVSLTIRAFESNEEPHPHGFTYQWYAITGDAANYTVDEELTNGLRITFTGSASVQLIFV